MKKFLIYLLPMFLVTPTFGESLIYLTSNAVETTIKEMVRSDLQMLTATKYELEMDPNTGKISVLGFYKVCAQAGFDIKKQEGYDRCQTFLQKMITKSGLGGADQMACVDRLDGMWATKPDGKKECVGRDGSVLKYEDSCINRNTGGTCYTQYQKVNIPYTVAKELITNADKNLTCANERFYNSTTIGGNPYMPRFMECSKGGRPVTFKFAGFSSSRITHNRDAAEMLCRLVNKEYGALYASDTQPTSAKVYHVCRKDGDGSRYVTTGDYIRNNTAECNTLNSLSQRVLGVPSGKGVYGPQQDTVSVEDGGSAVKPVRGLCVIGGGTAPVARQNVSQPAEPNRPDRIVGKPCADADLPSNATRGVYVTGGVTKWDCWDEQRQVTVKCSCAARECKDPYKIAKNNSGASLGYCTKERDSLNNCLAERAGNPEGVACCYLKSSVATWDGTHCVCTGNKEFSIVNGAGVCKTSPKTACEESGGHWGTRSGREECHCGTNQDYSPDGIYRDRGLKWSNATYPTGVCMCLSGYKWKDTRNKQLGCKPI